ncbi:hypothetical protein [Maribellus mangrovi]|uniref:hypothetical protein n=1 Tax=Maribellus mangrovi TaxID=3133146 RepID=UPI0030ED466B
MVEKEIRFRQKRELAQILSEALEFFKQEYRAILRMVAIYVLPFLVLNAGAQVYFQKNVLVNLDFTDPEALMADLGALNLNLFFLLLFGLFVQSLLVGTYYSYLEAYIKLGKGNFQLSDISSNFFSNSLLALGAGLVFTFASLFGLMLCVLPGIFLANTLSLMFFITVFEKQGIAYSTTKSWLLVRTQWWNTLAMNALGIIAWYSVHLIFSLLLFVLGFAGGFNTSVTEGPINYPQWYWILIGVSSAVSTIFMIIPYTLQAFQYFNLEERENPKAV